MFERAVEGWLYALAYVFDQHKTQKMCERPVLEDPGMLEIVPDQENNPEVCERTVEWGLLNITICSAQDARNVYKSMEAWQPSRYWNWCWTEDEKKITEKLCNDESFVQLVEHKSSQNVFSYDDFENI